MKLIKYIKNDNILCLYYKHIKMNALEFACFFERFQKSIGFFIDTDIIKIIYDYYQNIYENYSLLELIYELHSRNIAIICDWNKTSILHMINDIGIFLERKNKKLLNWIYYYNGKEKMIYIPKVLFSIKLDDTFQTSNYIIWCVRDIRICEKTKCVLLYLEDILQDNHIWRISVDKFLLKLDNDITIC